MFGAIGNLIKSFVYLLIGKTNKQTDKLNEKPDVISAKFDAVGTKRGEEIKEMVEAITELETVLETKKETLKKLTQEAEKLHNLQQGAAVMAKKRIEQLKSGNPDVPIEEINKDAEYQRCHASYNDFSSTLKEKEARIKELEEDVKSKSDRISQLGIKLTSMKRDLDKVKEEKADTIADVISSEQESKMNEIVARLSTGDGTEDELQKLRDVRMKAKARVKVTQTLAGTDTAAAEEEFLKHARESQANDEFAELVGLKADTVPAQKETVGKGGEKLPE